MKDSTCTVDGCDARVKARGWCQPHYARWHRFGDPGYLRPSPAERFHAKYVVDAAGCWIWQAGRDKDGYGVFKATGKTVKAHIFAWTLAHGQVPPGMVLDHIVCDTPPCVNPAHLRVTTNWGNVERTQNVCAVNARKTHCKRGHAFDEANTIKRATWRVCRTCKNEASVRYRALDASRASG